MEGAILFPSISLWGGSPRAKKVNVVLKLIKKPRERLFLLIKDVGSSGRTRTYNPPVTLDPMFSHRSGLSHQLSIESCRALPIVLLLYPRSILYFIIGTIYGSTILKSFLASFDLIRSRKRFLLGTIVQETSHTSLKYARIIVASSKEQ